MRKHNKKNYQYGMNIEWFFNCRLRYDLSAATKNVILITRQMAAKTAKAITTALFGHNWADEMSPPRIKDKIIIYLEVFRNVYGSVVSNMLNMTRD